jgi:RNA polymerase sigma factor (sigma-70 family)
MASPHLGSFIRRLRHALEPNEAGGLSDAELLPRWAHLRDEAAYEVLLWRHGPLVLSVCRRLLRNPQDVEDAFQATFLILVRKAGSISRRAALAGWLYRVAYRVALRARARAARRASREEPTTQEPAVEPGQDALWADVRPVLDEEVNRLPEKYRVPFVLCYLQGKTNAEAAREVGCPVGTVLSRLAWARERLRDRLTRRGVVLTVGLLAALLAQAAAPATVSAALVEATRTAALLFAAGSKAAVSAGAAALTQGVLRTMFLTKLKLVAAVVVVLGLLGTGAGLAVHQALAASPAAGDEDVTAKLAEAALKPNKHLVQVPSQRDGILLVVGTEIKDGEKVPDDQVISVKVGGETRKYRKLREGDAVEEGQLLGLVDDALARDELAIKKTKLDVTKAELEASNKTRDEAEQRYRTQLKLTTIKGGSDEDVRAAKLTWDRYIYEVYSKQAEVKVAEQEVKQVETLLRMHEIRSPVRGVLKTIYKHRGEAVRQYETVFVLRITDNRE